MSKRLHTLLVKLGCLLVPVFLGIDSFALDTSTEEAQCTEIGFKKKTQAYADCVLELLDRRTTQNGRDPDDATCRKYGFKPKSDNYAACRQQIDMARQDAQRQQAQYEQQQAQYEAQLAERKRERDKQRSLAMLQMGLGMLSGQYNANNAYGTIPSAPIPPQNLPRTYILPGGKAMSCTTTGTVTSCF